MTAPADTRDVITAALDLAAIALALSIAIVIRLSRKS